MKIVYFFLLTIIFFGLASLLPGSVWEGDEYFQMGRMLHEMPSLWDYLRERIVWSPRPLSEIILVGYYKICSITERPHAGVFNAILWCVFFVITGIGARSSTRLMIIPLTLFVVMALWGAPYEILYWPAGTAPYLLTCAFMVALLLTYLRPFSHADSTLQIIFLTGCAFSSEIGMLFTAFCVGLMIVYRFLERGPLRVKSIAPLFLPTISVGIVVFLSKHGRIAQENIHQAHLQVFNLTKETFSIELESLLKGPHFTYPLFNHSFLSNSAVYVLIIIGFFLFFHTKEAYTKINRNLLTIIIVSCLLTQITTIWISLSHYGFLTDRHGDVRLMLTFVTLVSLGALLASWNPIVIERKNLAFVPLTLVIVLMLPAFIPAWKATRLMLPEILRYKELTWQSGLASGDAMIFTCSNVSPLLITCPDGMNAGTYKAGHPDTNWIYTGVLSLFKKSSLTVVRP